MKLNIGKLGSNISFVALAISIMGSLCKMLHFSWADYLLIGGLSLLAVGALIKNLSEKTLDGFITGVTIAVWCVAVLFKLMHWPYSALLIQVGFVLLAVWGIRFFMSHKDEE